MIFTADYMRDTHRDVINHIDEVKARATVLAHEDAVLLQHAQHDRGPHLRSQRAWL